VLQAIRLYLQKLRVLDKSFWRDHQVEMRIVINSSKCYRSYHEVTDVIFEFSTLQTDVKVVIKKLVACAKMSDS
jgi:hypothetical protein